MSPSRSYRLLQPAADQPRNELRATLLSRDRKGAVKPPSG
jgi:hypothetical protein